MDRIPAEILCDIFFESLPNRGNEDEEPYDAPLSVSVASPLYFSHVCRRWREITLATVGLWSHLCIRYSARGSRKRRKNIKAVFSTWLKRTRGCPLNFCFWFSVSRAIGTQAHSVVGYIIKTLLSEQHRWRDVDFRWYHIRLSSQLPEIKLTNMPMLSSLTFYVLLDTENNNRACINLGKSSRLVHLYLKGDYTIEVGEDAALAMMKTASLENPRGFSGRSTITVCLDFLRFVPNLQDLEILYAIGRDHDPPSSEDDEPVLLRNLRSLHLDSGDCSTLIVDRLCLPALTELHIKQDPFTRGAQNSLRFLQRSSPPLTRLFLDSYGGAGADLVNFLGQLPTLEEIHFLRPCLSARFFQMLSVKDPSAVVCSGPRLNDYEHIVCPRLCVLCISSAYLIDLGQQPTEAFCAMILSRWEHATASRVLIDGSPSGDIASLRKDRTRLVEAVIWGKNILIEAQAVDPYCR